MILLYVQRNNYENISFFIMKYIATFRITSFYENENENKTAEQTMSYEAKNLDELWKILEAEDYDDEVALNFKAKSDCISTERDEIKIIDQNNKVVWSEKG